MNETPELYMLDSSVLVHFVRQSTTWSGIRSRWQLFLCEPTPIYSTVSEGELRSLALRKKWKSNRIDQMEFALEHFQEELISDPEVIANYAIIDYYLTTTGKTIGKNDIWIAATALTNAATLLTTDQDFSRLQTVGLKCVVIPIAARKR